MSTQRENEQYNAMRAECELSPLEAYSLKQRLLKFSRKVGAGSLSGVAPDNHVALVKRTLAAIREMEAVIDLYVDQQDGFVLKTEQPAPCAAIADEGL